MGTRTISSNSTRESGARTTTPNPAVINATVTIAGSPCEDGDVVCNFGVYLLLAGIVSGTLCCCVCCCWCWLRTPRHGQSYVDGIGRLRWYRRDSRADDGVEKTYVTWELDPASLAMFSCVDAQDREHRDLGETARSSEHRTGDGDEEMVCVVDDVGESCSVTVVSSSSVTVESSSSSELPKNHRLAFRSDGYDVNPAPTILAAYAHGSPVDYYSCTHRCWVRAVVTLDVLDRHVDGLHKEAVVYGVHLARTQQFRNHVPLHHLQRLLAVGHVVEVRTHPGRTWKRAQIRKIVYGAKDRFYVVVVDKKELIVSRSVIRQYIPAQSQVLRGVRRTLCGSNIGQGCSSDPVWFQHRSGVFV